MDIDNTQLNPTPQLAEDEIDLRQVVAALMRQKKLITGVAGGALLLSGIYAFTQKPVWQGEFQIVLETDNSTNNGLGQLASANPMLANLAGLGGVASKSSLKTEVKILESPSVLKPTYDFVKAIKAKGGENISRWSYSNWVKGSVSIELLKGTSVLNLKYEDTDKTLILPVLNQITDTYQNYSNLDSVESIDNGLSFAREQSDILKKKARDSNRELDIFKFTYGIKDNSRQSGLPSNLQNFLIQGKASKFNSPTPQLSTNSEPLEELGAINKELIRRLKFFTAKDPSVKRLQQEREAILQYIDQTGGGLISIADGGSKENNREILLRYNELKRTALRNDSALTALESELLSLQIEKSKKRQPWKLISTPTLLDTPVAPQKTNIMALGLLAGLVLGSGAALVIDRRTGLIFSDDELKSTLPAPLLERLSLHSSLKWVPALQLMAQGPLKNAQSIGLIPVGQPDSFGIQQFQKQLKEACDSREIKISQNLVNTKNCDTQLLLIQSGCVSRKQLAQLNQSLALQGTPIAGWVLLDPTMEAG